MNAPLEEHLAALQERLAAAELTATRAQDRGDVPYRIDTAQDLMPEPRRPTPTTRTPSAEMNQEK